MALVLADRVKETTTTAGTGTVTLLGAATGFQSFAVIGNTNTTYYTIAGQTTSEWEVGIGTYTASGTTLARTTVLSNSAGTQPTALTFSAGTKDVFVTYPAGTSVNLDASGNATALGTPVAFVGTNITGTAAGLTAGNVTTNANLTGAVTSVGNATSLGSFTSAQLLAALTNETGTGVAVFGTSPAITTSLTTASTTFALLNTAATTINFGGAATTLNLGAATGTMTVANTTLAAKAITASTTLGVTGVSTFAAGTVALPAITTTGDTNTGVYFPAADTIGLTTGGTERLGIDNAGNVGIGLTPIVSNGILQLASYSSVKALLELATITASAPAATTNFDVITQGVQYYTTNASANFTLNIRGSSTVTLNTIMAIGQSCTLAFLVTNGTTAYYPTAYQVDGASVTPKWQTGTAPTAGNASALDVYVITVIKTAAATFTVLASQTKFA